MLHNRIAYFENLRARRVTPLLAILLCLGFIALTFISSASAANHIIFDDALSSGWGNYSWGTTANFNATTAYAGNRSIGVTINDPWTALYLSHDNVFDSAEYEGIRFAINGGSSGGQFLNLSLVDADQNWSTSLQISPPTNDWQLLELPFSAFGNPSNVRGLVWQDASGNGASTFYIDQIELLEVGTFPEPTPPPDGSRQLRDLPLFESVPNGQWAGSGDGMTLVTNNWQLPVDYANSYNGLPSYSINASGSTGWWLAILAGSSWESYSIEPYHANGALEFDIKGASGGEDFYIGLQDVVFERAVKHYMPTQLNLSNYINVTTDWQHVSIPLTDLVPQSALGTFDLGQIYAVEISNYNTTTAGSTQVWLNNIQWTSPDNEPSYPPFRVNQVGYTTNGSKHALVSGFSDEISVTDGDSFSIRDIDSNSIVYSGSVALLADHDATASGERVFKADFTDFSTAGNYQLEMDGLQNSYPFTIAADAYENLLSDSMRYFFIQRQGIELSAANAGLYARGVGHPQDTSAQFSSGVYAPRDISQGWYDAGDYGKYVNAGATGVAELLFAYETYPEIFSDDQFNIPESGNGVPDILDEIRWELDWMLKMQDPNSGGFYHMVKSDADQDTTPDQSTAIRYIRDADEPGYGSRTNIRPTVATGSAVGALAHAAIVFESIDAVYSADLLAAAEFGWDYLVATPNLVTPPQGAQIPYNDQDDSDDRFYAAATLFRATGSAEYGNYVESVYSNIDTKLTDSNENAYGVGLMAIPGVLAYIDSTNPDTTTYNQMVSDFNTWRSTMTTRFANSVWQTTLEDADYYWGSNNPALTTPLALAVGSKILGTYDQSIVEIAESTLHYILGANPLALSYVSGYGENAIEKPFSQIFNFDGIPNAPDGIIIGGPNQYNNSLLYSQYAGKAYQDNAAAWSTNEHTVYWNSTLVFAAALAIDAADGTDPGPNPTPEPTATSPAPTLTPTPLPSATNTPVPPSPTPVEERVFDASSQQNVLGAFAGSVTDIQSNNASSVTIQEATTSGNPSNRISQLEMAWTFDNVSGEILTVYANSWADSSTDNDEFEFSYSFDNSTFTPMFLIESTIDNNNYQSFELPTGSFGTVTIRLEDTDRTPGNNKKDQVWIDHLYIEATSNGGPPPVTSTPLPTATNTPLPTSTSTPLPTTTNTPLPTSTSTPLPTTTNTPLPTSTSTPLPTATNTPLPTSTSTPLPTATNTPLPTSTSTPVPSPSPTSEPEPTIITYAADGSTRFGSVAGSFANLEVKDNALYVITEDLSNGQASNRKSRMNHVFTFDIPASSSTTVYANIWADLSSDNDQFKVEYSLDNSTFTLMWTIIETMPNDGYLTFELPSDVSGTVYIRLIDSDRVKGNSIQDSVFIDHLYMESSIGTPPPTPEPEVGNLAMSETTTSGTVLGEFTDTHSNDGVAEQITEYVTGGRPVNRKSRTNHVWTFNVNSNDDLTLYANMWANVSTDNDTFKLQFSTDNNSFIDMFVVNATTDDDVYQTYQLPAGISGPLYIRLIDTDRGFGNSSPDTVWIDHLYLSAENQSAFTIFAPESSVPTGVQLNGQSIHAGSLNILAVVFAGLTLGTIAFLNKARPMLRE